MLSAEPVQIPTLNDLADISLRSILFNGEFGLKGNGFTLGAGGSRFRGRISLQVPLTLSASQSWVLEPGADVYLSGGVHLQSSDVELVLGTYSRLLFSRAVTGNGNLTLRGGGNLTFTGSEDGLTTATGLLTVFDSTVSRQFLPGRDPAQRSRDETCSSKMEPARDQSVRQPGHSIPPSRFNPFMLRDSDSLQT